MHRFHVPTERIVDGRVLLSSEQQKQLKHVLRMRPGDEIAVFDGSGLEFHARLEADSAGAVSAVVHETLKPDTEPSTRLTVVQSIPKGEKLELILQKCTEVGAAEFLVVTTERSVPKISSDKLPSRLERWRSVVREAAEQSGRVRIPAVDGVFPLADVLERVKGRGTILAAWERETGMELFSALRSLTGVPEVTLLIGPEGGLTPAEISAAVEAGAIPVSLGPRILRTETAAIVASAIVVYALER